MSKKQLSSNINSSISDRRVFARLKPKVSSTIKCVIPDSSFSNVKLLMVSAQNFSVETFERPNYKIEHTFLCSLETISSSSMLNIDLICKIKSINKSQNSKNYTTVFEIISSSDSMDYFLAGEIEEHFEKIQDRRNIQVKNSYHRREYQDNPNWQNFPLKIMNAPKYQRKTERRSNLTSNIKNNHRKTDRRKKQVDSGVHFNFWIKSITSIITCLCDGIIWVLPIPKWLIKLLVGEGNFAFIAHPRNFNDIPRMFPFGKYLPESFVKLWFKHQWPFITSRIFCTDSKTNQKRKGWLLIAPLWAEQMLKNTKIARNQVINTVKFAEKIGCQVAGLGAFTSIVTHDGKDLIGQTKIGVTTGNAFSAAVAVANISHAFSLKNKPLKEAKIVIIGAAGSVGSGCSRALVHHVNELHLIDINERALGELTTELTKTILSKDLKTKLTFSNILARVSEFDGVIVVTNTIKSVVDEKHLKQGAIVVDCAQPKNVSKNIPEIRKDVIVIESAVVNTPGLVCGSDLDVNQGESLGCMTETLILSTLKTKKMLLGKVTFENMKNIYKIATDLGIELAYFRNSSGFINEQNLKQNMTQEA